MRGRAVAAGGRAWIAGLLLAAAAQAASPELVVTAGGRTATFTAEALLAHHALVTITVPGDVAYHRTMTYQAVPLPSLLAGVHQDDSLRFVATDGFAATIPAAPLLATGAGAARAYLAVEPPGTRWPALKVGEPATAGPFYVVWLDPRKSRIAPEQWPYQVARIEEIAPIATRFPVLLPAATVGANDPVRRGLAVFTTNCVVCHTLNHGGDASIGPDLNVPFNPTEYLREDFLRRIVRNPQSVRTWPDSKMPGFSVDAISARDLDDLVAYLRHMATRRVGVPAAK